MSTGDVSRAMLRRWLMVAKSTKGSNVTVWIHRGIASESLPYFDGGERDLVRSEDIDQLVFRRRAQAAARPQGVPTHDEIERAAENAGQFAADAADVALNEIRYENEDLSTRPFSKLKNYFRPHP